jgi:hypothetical protein
MDRRISVLVYLMEYILSLAVHKTGMLQMVISFTQTDVNNKEFCPLSLDVWF